MHIIMHTTKEAFSLSCPDFPSQDHNFLNCKIYPRLTKETYKGMSMVVRNIGVRSYSIQKLKKQIHLLLMTSSDYSLLSITWKHRIRDYEIAFLDWLRDLYLIQRLNRNSYACIFKPVDIKKGNYCYFSNFSTYFS